MEITEVRVKLMGNSEDRLQAFCSITFDDCFVIRDLKVIEGSHGPFVAMPSRKRTFHCSDCGFKNHLSAIASGRGTERYAKIYSKKQIKKIHMMYLFDLSKVDSMIFTKHRHPPFAALRNVTNFLYVIISGFAVPEMACRF